MLCEIIPSSRKKFTYVNQRMLHITIKMEHFFYDQIKMERSALRNENSIWFSVREYQQNFQQNPLIKYVISYTQNKIERLPFLAVGATYYFMLVD